MAFSNTVAAGLSLAKVMGTVLEEFVAELLPLKAFSMGVTGGKTLNALGTKTLEVPYLSAVTAASNDFDAAAGECYVVDTTTTATRQVVVNKRKYQAWGVTSEQYAITPVLGSLNFAKIKARKLAADVLADILAVITPGNFPQETAVGAASAMDADLMQDVAEDADGFLIPSVGRSAILNSGWYTSLLKDSNDVSVHGSTSARWDAQVPRIAGMDTYKTITGLAAATDAAAGIVVYPSAILVAMAPLEPHPAIRQKLIDFQVFTHPESGISLVYKMIADETCDSVIELVEASYGFAVGEADAMLRLVVS